MKSSILFSVLIIGIILGLPGCAGYNARPLSRIVMQQESRSKETISFGYQIFTKNDCKKYLDRDVIAKGYQPVHLTIVNNSSRQINFSLQNFNVTCVDPNVVAQQVHTSTAKRTGAYCAGALFLPFLIIPAIVDGIGSSEANHKLDNDFDHKALRDQIINPQGMLNGLIFVPQEQLKGPISFTLTDLSNGQKYTLNTAQSTILI